jgi:hypothetical protein
MKVVGISLCVVGFVFFLAKHLAVGATLLGIGVLLLELHYYHYDEQMPQNAIDAFFAKHIGKLLAHCKKTSLYKSWTEYCRESSLYFEDSKKPETKEKDEEK